MSAIDNSEVTHGRDDITTGVNLSTVINPETRKVKRILHFSDGTLEESDSESQEDILDSHSAAPAGPGSKTLAQATIDPKDLSWARWMWYQSSNGGTKTLNFLDYLGENFAYYLGITSSKYQYEIDEYHRAKQEEERRANWNSLELASWSSPSTSRSAANHAAQSPKPILTDVVSSNTDVVV